MTTKGKKFMKKEIKNNQIIIGLNTNRVLEHWTTSDAMRELLVNSHDEHKLANVNRPVIFKFEGDKAIIQDFGRGIKQGHFIYNINNEKRISKSVTGKFGFGLTDALSRLHGFERHRNVIIETKDYTARMKKVPKGTEGDQENAVLIDLSKKNAVDCGTKITIWPVSRIQYNETKENILWLQDNKPKLLYQQPKGAVYEKKGNWAQIFIRGIKAHSESNFAFSYNIEAPNMAMDKSINRDRKTLDKKAVLMGVEKILNMEMPISIAKTLLEQRTDEFEKSQIIRARVYKILKEKHAFVTTAQLKNTDEYQKMLITSYEENTGKIIEIKDKDADVITKNKLKDFEYIVRHEGKKYKEYEYLELEKLTEVERDNYNYVKEMLKQVTSRISLKVITHKVADIQGLYNDAKSEILIVRHVLKSLKETWKTLVHQYACSYANNQNNILEFQNDLLNAAFVFSRQAN